MGANDALGRRVIRAATELGLHIPNQVGVLGVNNDVWLAQLAPVTMSSVEPDWQQLGYRGAQMLDGLVTGQYRKRFGVRHGL